MWVFQCFCLIALSESLTSRKHQSLYPKYTIHGFEYDTRDPHNKLSVHTLKSHLRSQLSALHPGLQLVLVATIRKELSKKKDIDGIVPPVHDFPISSNVDRL